MTQLWWIEYVPHAGSFKSTNDQGNKATEDLKKPEKTMTPASSMRKSSSFGEKLKGTIDDKKPVIQAPKRTPTFGDEHLVNTGEIKHETPRPKVPPMVPHSVFVRPRPPPSPPVNKADAWEREELEKIKERYILITI